MKANHLQYQQNPLNASASNSSCSTTDADLAVQEHNSHLQELTEQANMVRNLIHQLNSSIQDSLSASQQLEQEYFAGICKYPNGSSVLYSLGCHYNVVTNTCCVSMYANYVQKPAR